MAITAGRQNGSNILIRTSERQSFLTCRQRWHWAYVECLKPPRTDTKLVFGDLVHQALAAYYKRGHKRGPHPTETFEKLCEKLSDEQDTDIWADNELLDMADLGIDVLNRYVEHWSEADKEYEVISSEQTFQVPIGRTPSGQRLIYVGTIDGVWRHRPSARFRFVEHKTTTAISGAALPMDEQVGAYWTFGPRWLRLKGFLKSGEQLDGILYNWLRKAKRSEGPFDELGRKLNKNGTISKNQPPPFFDRQLTFRGDFEAQRVKERVRQEITDMLEARGNPAKIYKNPGPSFFPNCKFCSFRDMCELHETGNDWQAFRDAAFIKWEPYAAHERVERR